MSSLEATIEHLARAMKMPTIRRTWKQLAEQARDEGWSHEEYLAAVLQRQVADREASGTALRIAGAHFPSMKTVEDFNCDFQPSLRRDVLAHLATTTFIPKAENVILLGPPGVGKTIWVLLWASKPDSRGTRRFLIPLRAGCNGWRRRIRAGDWVMSCGG